MPKKGLKDYKYDYEGPTPKGFEKGSGAKLGAKKRKPIEGIVAPHLIYPLSLGYEHRVAERKKAAEKAGELEAAKVYAEYIAKHPIEKAGETSFAKFNASLPKMKKDEKAMTKEEKPMVEEKKARKPRSDKGMPRKKK
tara:strand:+ start:39 stop:452 length:414 start_codon:yes stop_codon:yes gene_type:complete